MFTQRKPEPKTKNFVVHKVTPDLRFKLMDAKARIKADTWLDFLEKTVQLIKKTFPEE